MRYFLELSYFGKAFGGWQKQPNACTVQDVLQQAMATLLRTEITIVGAGRTDAGVHAKKMFAHFDVDSPLSTEKFCYKLNALLPKDIAIRAVHPVKSNAHARDGAIKRVYEYHITKSKTPFLVDFAYHHYSALDLSKMNDAAQRLLGDQDFKSFSKSKTDVNTYFCNVFQAYWEQRGEVVVFTISANRFLRNMVRAIVGTLLNVGTGKIPPEALETIVKQKKRSLAGISVPAHGLYLTDIVYPLEFFNE